jgi:inhibitor of KinA sporulation pathway (predicted exonuclease)
MEIVQIGIVEADMHALAITRSKSYYVRPKGDVVGEHLFEITGLTSSFLKAHGRPLTEVLRSLAKEYGLTKPTTFTWGDDFTPIADECKRLAIRNPFTGPFVDLGYQFSLLYDCHSVGLARAVETLGMTFEGAPHDALHDARNTAHVHLEMVRRTRLIVPPLIEVKRSA